MKRIYSGYVRVSCIVALSASITLSAIAGPGPQFWAQQHAKAAAASDTKAPPAMACPKCKDGVVTVLTPGSAGGKIPARAVTVGNKHACDGCGGEIKSNQGKTTSDMRSNCPVCAKTEPNCCKLSR